MLTRVQIKNFKSIGEGPGGSPGVDIELKPLTFLVGPNGGGKSSILEAIGFACTSPNADRIFENASLTNLRRNPTNLSSSEINIHFEDTTVYRVRLEPWTERVAAPGETSLGGGSSYGRVFASFPQRKQLPRREEGVSTFVDRLREEVFLLTSTRGNLAEEEFHTGTLPTWVGRNGEHVQRFLGTLPNATLEEIADTISQFGLSYPQTSLRHQGMVAGEYSDTPTSLRLSLSLASSGQRQALIVIVQVIASTPGSLLMIEEPEISLHPEAQVAMCRFLAEHAAKGKQISVTTHSPFVLLALQYPVQEGIIKPEQIAIYEIRRDKQTGATSAKHLPTGKDGAPKGGVPSFSKVENRLLRDWMKTLPEQ